MPDDYCEKKKKKRPPNTLRCLHIRFHAEYHLRVTGKLYTLCSITIIKRTVQNYVQYIKDRDPISYTQRSIDGNVRTVYYAYCTNCVHLL